MECRHVEEPLFVRHKTLVVVAHRLSAIRSADRILVLGAADGPSSIVEHGTHDELLAEDGVYAHLWRERARAAEWRVARG